MLTSQLSLGYSGYTINQISSAADHSITTYKPNIILLHAGTNDVSRGDNTPDPVSGAPDRLGQLIDKCVSRNQDAAIIVAQIINAKDGATESKIQAFNKAVPGVVKQRADDGHHVMVVDMSSITTSDLADDLHPSDAGYRKSKFPGKSRLPLFDHWSCQLEAHQKSITCKELSGNADNLDV